MFPWLPTASSVGRMQRTAVRQCVLQFSFRLSASGPIALMVVTAYKFRISQPFDYSQWCSSNIHRKVRILLPLTPASIAFLGKESETLPFQLRALFTAHRLLLCLSRSYHSALFFMGSAQDVLLTARKNRWTGGCSSPDCVLAISQFTNPRKPAHSQRKEAWTKHRILHM